MSQLGQPRSEAGEVRALTKGSGKSMAIGIVMAQRGCGAEDALDVLRQASTRLRVPLTEVADRLVTAIASRSG